MATTFGWSLLMYEESEKQIPMHSYVRARGFRNRSCCHRQLAGSRSAGRLHVVALTGNIAGFIPFVSLLSTPPLVGHLSESDDCFTPPAHRP